jgi:tetratricopeptide (TPR) repeat protein
MAVERMDPGEFVESVLPMLEGRNLPGLLELLKRRWTPDQITSLLACESCDARKVAALALALVGGKCCLPDLSNQLRHPDPMVNQMAEHAMWSIWFRCGTTEANHELCRGTRALNRRDFDQATRHFTRAMELDPEFAEAYNQRAIVRYLQERYDESLGDCLRTIERMPCHFGAWSGLGHCHAHEGRLQAAVEAYQKALSLNPHLDGIAQAVCELRKRLREESQPE